MYTQVANPDNVPSFLLKLWTLVEDESTNDLICWDFSGKSFHIYDQMRFSREVLPLYFKHNSMASFTRQLNMYGFRKVTNISAGSLKVEVDDVEYKHPYFVRGNEGYLELIKRKITAGKTDEFKVKQDDVAAVLSDVRAMKNKQESFNAKIDELKCENEALWREMANYRQQHIKQQNIINKLIQFLVSLIGTNRSKVSNMMKRKMQLMLEDSGPPNKRACTLTPSNETSSNTPCVPEALTSKNLNKTPVNAVIKPSVAGLQIHDVTEVITKNLNDANTSNALQTKNVFPEQLPATKTTDENTENTDRLNDIFPDFSDLSDTDLFPLTDDNPENNQKNTLSGQFSEDIVPLKRSKENTTEDKAIALKTKNDLFTHVDNTKADLTKIKDLLSNTINPSSLYSLFPSDVNQLPTATISNTVPLEINESNNNALIPAETNPGAQLVRYEPLEENKLRHPYFSANDDYTPAEDLETLLGLNFDNPQNDGLDDNEDIFNQGDSNLNTPKISQSVVDPLKVVNAKKIKTKRP